MARVHLLLPLCVFTASCFDDSAPQVESSGSGSTTAAGSTSASATLSSSSSESGSTSSGTSTSTTGSAQTSSSGQLPCIDTDECADGELCIDERCMSCSAASNPDEACAADFPQTPFCDPDTEICIACLPASCSGATPVCDDIAGCVACTEHAQCPESACRLMGPNAGECFDVADVEEVSDITELTTLIQTLAIGQTKVIRVLDGTYTISGGLVFAGEVAVLGNGPSTIFTGGATNAFSVGGDSYLYVANVALDNGPGRGFQCNMCSGLWLDDTVASGFNAAVAVSGGQTHLRRSRLTANFGGGAFGYTVSVTSGGSLFVENSSIGPGGDDGIEAFGANAVDIRYTTIAGNIDGVACDEAQSGQIRNSIVLDGIDPTCGLGIIDTAVSGAGGGTDVGAYDPAWFVDPNAFDFHLTNAGQAIVRDIADWDDGDPLVDFDGDPRPMNAPGFPGLDEP